MGLKNMGSTDASDNAQKHKISKLVVEDVHIVTREVEIAKPIFKEVVVEVPKYVDREIEVISPKIVEEEVKTQSVTVNEKTINIEHPVFKDVEVERPIFKDVEVIRTNIKEKEKIVEIPRVIQKTKVIEEEYIVKVPKLVEEIIRVPRIQYIPTEVERIVWQDVPREKCSHCNKEI